MHLLKAEHDLIHASIRSDKSFDQPLLTWVVTSFKDNLIKESDPFVIDG